MVYLGEMQSKPTLRYLLSIPMCLAKPKSLLCYNMLGRMWCHGFLTTSELILEKNDNCHTLVGCSVHWFLAKHSHILWRSPYTAELDFRYSATLFQTHFYVEK